MEQTLTQRGAISEAHHKRSKGKLRPTRNPARPASVISTFHASVGDFALCAAQFGIQLEIRVGQFHRLLHVYETVDAALLALRNRQSHFEPWDRMGRNAATIQLDTAQRWDRIVQEP